MVRAGVKTAWCALVLLACGGGSATRGEGSTTEGPAPELGLVDLNGKVRQLAEFESKVVLLDFWATWCKPCLKSLPLYDAWQRELRERGLVVLAASVDDDDGHVGDFVKAYVNDLVVLRDRGGKAAERYGLPTMPTAFVIGRDGRVRYQHAGFEEATANELKAQILAALDAR